MASGPGGVFGPARPPSSMTATALLTGGPTFLPASSGFHQAPSFPLPVLMRKEDEAASSSSTLPARGSVVKDCLDSSFAIFCPVTTYYSNNSCKSSSIWPVPCYFVHQSRQICYYELHLPSDFLLRTDSEPWHKLVQYILASVRFCKCEVLLSNCLHACNISFRSKITRSWILSFRYFSLLGTGTNSEKGMFFRADLEQWEIRSLELNSYQEFFCSKIESCGSILLLIIGNTLRSLLSQSNRSSTPRDPLRGAKIEGTGVLCGSNAGCRCRRCGGGALSGFLAKFPEAKHVERSCDDRLQGPIYNFSSFQAFSVMLDCITIWYKYGYACIIPVLNAVTDYLN